MFKPFVFFIFLFPWACFAQSTITGKVLNKSNTRPVANASVFLSNATIGDRTAGDGSRALHIIKPGKYELVVSVIGFETYRQSIR